MLKVHIATGQNAIYLCKVMTFNNIINYTNNYAIYILKVQIDAIFKLTCTLRGMAIK